MKDQSRNTGGMRRSMLALAVVMAAVGLGACGGGGDGDVAADCVGFEGVSAGAALRVGDSFRESSATMSLEAILQANGTLFDQGQAGVGASGAAGGTGQELVLGNITLRTRFDEVVTCVTLRYREQRSDVHFGVGASGTGRVYGDITDLDGEVIEGVYVQVFPDPTVPGRGTLELSGTMDQFFLGGEELIVDEICRCVPSGCVRRCMTFEEAAAGTTIEFGETLVEGDNRATGVGFLWPQDDLYFDGEATIVPAAMGQEVQMGNLNLAFTFCEPSPRVTFSYRAFGGDVNLGVQGDLRRVGSFAELDGAMVGGAQVRVTQASIQGGVTGQVAVEGNVGKVTIGGEELFLDDVCP